MIDCHCGAADTARHLIWWIDTADICPTWCSYVKHSLNGTSHLDLTTRVCERSPIKNHRSTKRWLIRLHYIKQSSVWQRVTLCRIQSGWIATIHIPNKSHQENETQCGGNVLRRDETLLWGAAVIALMSSDGCWHTNFHERRLPYRCAHQLEVLCTLIMWFSLSEQTIFWGSSQISVIACLRFKGCKQTPIASGYLRPLFWSLMSNRVR